MVSNVRGFRIARKPKRGPDGRGRNGRRTADRPSLPTLAQFFNSPASHLATLDVDALNIMCAAGLPRAEKVEPARLLNWLDDAAHQVGLETRRHWYRFDRSPGMYKNSPGYFCCYFLLQVLQEDFRVRYNPARVRDPAKKRGEEKGTSLILTAEAVGG